MGENAEGIYLSRNGQLETVADTTTAIPNHDATFQKLGIYAIDGSDVAFNGSDGTISAGQAGTIFQRGIYFKRGEEISSVIETSDVLDGRVVRNVTLGGLDSGAIAFRAELFDTNDGSFSTAIFRADPVEPQTSLNNSFFTGLGFLEGGATQFSGISGNGGTISDDGSTVIGSSLSEKGLEPFRWTAERGGSKDLGLFRVPVTAVQRLEAFPPMVRSWSAILGIKRIGGRKKLEW